ncbi:GPI ethanolamine phosphate transferas-like protein 2 [Lepidopterella palustris CBS 459.81]|uniref:GPI ethanolamine phosphate transferase 2 n=1 Tax=Lepidopterella palustris CBS 459.81 TaxID=1314670 RepID=A0A8E2EDD8_9PEZI|nr:GPI ethanolamine phosphate transferas-like protein 2 [Lepidopterella palustris CBS 459.81]
MSDHSRSILLAVANFLIPVAVLVFATGFFPYKPFLPGLAKFEKLEYGDPPEGQFDKVIFMVVDALRSDFVYSENSGFKFTQSLISSGEAIPFTAHATSPTITMPRVKAITTGSIPSFLDVILNFAESDTTSTLASQDTWLAQLKAKEGGKLVMYGDDTWLKLFPNTFSRADGTSSFFVSDFTEVDNNVTRHVPEELLNSDWNAMIMHYLGLDHIGHKSGPNSPNMIPKQTEMDGVVRQIYEAMEGEPHLESTLFVLCGDHGMNDGGNHGGSSPGETSPALVFISPKFKALTNGSICPMTLGQDSQEFEYYTKIEQSDIAPTLAGLLGFPVPLNNLGVFIPQFLSFWPNEADQIQILVRNARQINTIVKATFPNSDFSSISHSEGPCDGSLPSGDELACKWRRILQLLVAAEGKLDPNILLPPLVEFCKRAQDIMSSTASNYDVSRLVSGTLAAFVSVALTLLAMRHRFSQVSSTGIFLTLVIVFYCAMMFASSYVEEEQNFWYWSASAWFFYLFLFESRKEWFGNFALHPAVMLLALLRVVRRWNQTGQKYAGAPDIVHSTFLKTPFILWSLVGTTYLAITTQLGRHIARSLSDSRQGSTEHDIPDITRVVGALAVLPLGAIALFFKLSFTAKDAPELVQGMDGVLLSWIEGLSLIGLARVIFWGIAAGMVWLVVCEWRKTNAHGEQDRGGLAAGLFDFLSLFLITQTRAQNIPLYLAFRAQLFFLAHLNLTSVQITASSLLLSHVSFFALGNSNAISSIDLSNAYNGVSGYNVLAVGLLVFVGNWAGPIYWASAGSLLLGEYDGAEVIEVAENGFQVKPWVAVERARLKAETRAGQKNVQGLEKQEVEPSILFDHLALLTLFTSFSLLAVMAACTILRTHLFIWTVFSPKYLYAMAWGLAYHLGINVSWGSVMWWVSQW